MKREGKVLVGSVLVGLLLVYFFAGTTRWMVAFACAQELILLPDCQSIHLNTDIDISGRLEMLLLFGRTSKINIEYCNCRGMGWSKEGKIICASSERNHDRHITILHENDSNMERVKVFVVTAQLSSYSREYFIRRFGPFWILISKQRLLTG